MEANQQVKQFIANIANKEYKDANVSLQKVIETKLKERIKDALVPKN